MTDAPGFDVIADELYGLPPDEFVPARDDRVAAAKESGDRDLARALARLRRPTKAAWLANLLARHRTEQLDGLVSLARSLTQAQQELDGDALRALSGQRHRAVGAMARDAGRLAARRGEAVNDALVREVAGILDAALADPAVAEEVRAGRLTKTVRYSGFGPAGGDTDGSGAVTTWPPGPPRPRNATPALRATSSPTKRTPRPPTTRTPAVQPASGPSGNAPSASGANSSPPNAPPGNASSPRPRPRRKRPAPVRSPTRPTATARTSATPPPATGSPSSPRPSTPPATRSRPPWRPSAPPPPPPATRPAARPRRPSAPPAPAARLEQLSDRT